jgi:prolyl oligopeptidase
MFADQILLKLRSDWKIGSGASEKLIPSGSLLSVSLEELIASGVNSQFAVIFTPSARISLSGYTKTKTRLILETLENVKSRLHFWNYNDGVFGGWSYAGEWHIFYM